MTKAEYVALKSALMIARLDDSDPNRLALPFDDGSLTARRANVKVYKAQAGRLASMLTRLEPEPGCALCSPARRPSAPR